MKSSLPIVLLIAVLAVVAACGLVSACPPQAQVFAAPSCGYEAQAQAFYAPPVQLQAAPIQYLQAQAAPVYFQPAAAFAQASYGYAAPQAAFVQRSFYAAPVAAVGRVDVNVGRQRRAFFLPGRQAAANRALSSALGVPARAVH